MFCPKCGSILVPKKEDTKKVMACSSCGYKTDKTRDATIKEVTGKKTRRVEVIEHGELDTLPKTAAECPKCGYKEARYWLVQTRAGDEPETKFLRCVKCEHTWRDYD
ncbi:transcription factor S [Candidatus Woesearchaeota archaeon]|nr:transcription factor S [Candidatus Woesearchaeota archaeon]